MPFQNQTDASSLAQSVGNPKPTDKPGGEEETLAKRRTSDAVDGTRVPVVSLEVLLVVADRTLVDQPVLGAGEVRRSIPGREIKRQPAGLPRDHALRVACVNTRGPLGSSEEAPMSMQRVGGVSALSARCSFSLIRSTIYVCTWC